MSNKVVIVTGTSSGFGWLTAQTLAAAGHTVYASMRDIEGRNADKARTLSAVPNITVLDVSLTDEASVQNAINTIIAKEERIDVLVNNAGIAKAGVAESFTTADVQELFDVNVFAPWRLMKAVLPAMRQQAEGLIINVSSGFGRFSAPFTAAYGASKFGLEGLSESLHYEVKPLGVDVAIVQPGAFPTEMNQKANFGSDTSVADNYPSVAPVMNQWMAAIGGIFETVKPDPQEVANAILHLISLPKGQRPLRTVVDRATGKFVEIANEAVQAEYTKVMAAFGMQDLVA
jgi:NAD(P)-dependent dehydrogenase (short-subunit alcohol dehydrogenase family)